MLITKGLIAFVIILMSLPFSYAGTKTIKKGIKSEEVLNEVLTYLLITMWKERKQKKRLFKDVDEIMVFLLTFATFSSFGFICMLLLTGVN